MHARVKRFVARMAGAAQPPGSGRTASPNPSASPGTDLQRAALALPFGKRMQGAVYLHAHGLRRLPPEQRAQIERAAGLAGLSDVYWNVAKVSLSAPRVSLLLYPAFFEEAFPVLAYSCSVHLETGAVHTQRHGSDNPPVLHRKEQLLPPDDPRVPMFEALTAALEARGLLDQPSTIGRRKPWEARLRARGVRVQGHRLVFLSGRA
jgi:DNA phosphorothioation-associated putative methyltransferase